MILGCANQAGEDNRNVPAWPLLLAGLPVEIPGQTVNRLCGSGLQAVASAAHAVRAGEGDVFVAGGVESMTRAPYVVLKPGKAWDRTAQHGGHDRRLALHQPPDARRLDHLARPNRRAGGGVLRDHSAGAGRVRRREPAPGPGGPAEGVFADEIVPVETRRDGKAQVVDRDEPPRSGVTADGLAKLPPAFMEGGTVTAGSSSGINDGAAALAVVSAEAAEALGGRPLARIVATAVAGVDPA